MAWTWTAASWRAYSKQGKFWRSSKFNAIETAVGAYNPRAAEADRLRKLKGVLDAVSAWRIDKQVSKSKGTGFASPRTARDKGDLIAAKESVLVEQGVIDDSETLSVRSAVTDTLVADVVAEVGEVMNLVRSAWGGTAFTDPTRHLATNFRYLVTAQSESIDVVEYRERTVSNPALISEALISASVITHDSAHLWGPSGFVLDAPAPCVGSALAGDMATRNAVAEGHALESYREILRLYLDGGGTGGFGLPAPAELRRTTGHNEVAVLGRSYGHTTRVVGIFVLVDRVAATVDTIEPAKVARFVTRMIRRGTNATTLVLDGRLPSVTAERMRKYRELNRNLGLPIVQVPVGPGVTVGGTYWANLYKGNSIFPMPASVVDHGSPEHLALLRQRDQYTITIAEAAGHTHPADCKVCIPA